ncbi:hypothetical protein [Haloplanus sp. C73]|uniref:hypothetical protein n=1 Tax=Haloplanus sp. C73 TaxID=3421641 RepID=UPI003EBC2E74
MVNRRSYLQGGAVFALGVGGVVDRLASMTEHRWTRVQTPTSRALYAATKAASTQFAAGSNGIVLQRTNDGWTVVRRNGPSGNGNNLRALGVTDDGARLWMAGASGALGEYDVDADELTDHTAPDDVTDTFTALSVAGSGDEPTVYVADASGSVHVSRDGGGSWTHLTPGSGATIHDIHCYGETSGVLVDGNGQAFETTTGTDWRRAGLDTDDHLAAVDAHGADDAHVVGTRVHERTGDGWSATDVTEAALNDVTVCTCGCIHAVGANGTIAHYPGEEMGHADGWQVSTPTATTLHGVALGHPHVAVGESGAIFEK